MTESRSMYGNLPKPQAVNIRQLQLAGNDIFLKDSSPSDETDIASYISELLKGGYKRMILVGTMNRQGNDPIKRTLIINKSGLGLKQKTLSHVLTYRYMIDSQTLSVGDIDASSEDYSKFARILDEFVLAADQGQLQVFTEPEVNRGGDK